MKLVDKIIDIKELSFSYPDGREALKGISLSIGKGEKVALVGPNGAGKSTLLLHLNGILTGKGTILVSGMALEKEYLKMIRAKVGLVFQQPDDQLFSPTVYEDVAYGPVYQGLDKDEIDRRVKESLSAVGMCDYIERNSFHLSTGEKKRIAIATVLSMQPDILVMDEPTAGLDPRSRRDLIELLRQLPQSMLIATHDLAMVKELLPRIIIVDRGRVVADDETDTILSNRGLLQAHGLE